MSLSIASCFQRRAHKPASLFLRSAQYADDHSLTIKVTEKGNKTSPFNEIRIASFWADLPKYVRGTDLLNLLKKLPSPSEVPDDDNTLHKALRMRGKKEQLQNLAISQLADMPPFYLQNRRISPECRELVREKRMRNIAEATPDRLCMKFHIFPNMMISICIYI